MPINKSLNIKDIDIVLPCYNPPKNWVNNLLESIAHLQKLLPDCCFHIILVNDGATHNVKPSDIAQLQTHLPHFQYIEHKKNNGKGYVLRTGVKKSKRDICLYTDIDFPYTEKSFMQLYQALANQECDVAVGIKNAAYYQQVPPLRIFISKLLRYLVRLFLGISITDTQCGLKGFTTKGKNIFLQTTINRYLFDLEFIFLAEHTPQIRLQAIEIDLKEGVDFSTVNWKILYQEGLNFLSILWKQFIYRKKRH